MRKSRWEKASQPASPHQETSGAESSSSWCHQHFPTLWGGALLQILAFLFNSESIKTPFYSTYYSPSVIVESNILFTPLLLNTYCWTNCDIPSQTLLFLLHSCVSPYILPVLHQLLPMLNIPSSTWPHSPPLLLLLSTCAAHLLPAGISVPFQKGKRMRRTKRAFCWLLLILISIRSGRSEPFVQFLHCSARCDGTKKRGRSLSGCWLAPTLQENTQLRKKLRLPLCQWAAVSCCCCCVEMSQK